MEIIDDCEKHGPYSVFCRSCDMEEAMKPICVPCERFYRPAKTGFAFIEGMPVNKDTKPGKAGRSLDWSPYKLWSGDLWRCPDCGSEVVIGTGFEPVRHHYQPDFDEQCALRGANLLIKDC